MKKIFGIISAVVFGVMVASCGSEIQNDSAQAMVENFTKSHNVENSAFLDKNGKEFHKELSDSIKSETFIRSLDVTLKSVYTKDKFKEGTYMAKFGYFSSVVYPNDKGGNQLYNIEFDIYLPITDDIASTLVEGDDYKLDGVAVGLIEDAYIGTYMIDYSFKADFIMMDKGTKIVKINKNK